MRKFVVATVLVAASALGLSTIASGSSPQNSVLAFNFSADTNPPSAGAGESYVIAVNTTPVTLKGVVFLSIYLATTRSHHHVEESGITCEKRVVNGKAACTFTFPAPGVWTVVAALHGARDGRVVTRSVTTLDVGSLVPADGN